MWWKLFNERAKTRKVSLISSPFTTSDTGGEPQTMGISLEKDTIFRTM